MSSLILVSNRLPVRLDESGQPHRTTGGLASALAALESECDQLWVGWNGEAIADDEDPTPLAEKLRELAIEPVFLNQEEVDGFYEHYSNGTLWPLLHSMSQRAQFDPDAAAVYRAVNEKFTEAVARVAGQGDTVWVHDYHLFLLPQLLRAKRPDLKIGFFLHTPFPSSDLFRILPERREILLGLLGADLIGFHTYNYLRHFRSSLLRVLGLETEHDSLFYKGRRHRLGVYPIGHNSKGFQKAMAGQAYRDARTELLEDLGDRKLVLNVERLDYTKGVPQKLAAIRYFLEHNPDLVEKVMFLIIAVPSRQNVEEYIELTEEVQREVGAINGDFSTTASVPVHFLHRGFPPAALASFYALADVCLVTPLVDGMNLVAKEFIDCKRRSARARPGVLVLSEFAGAAAEMSQAWMVNPYHVTEVASAIRCSLEMSSEECWERIEIMQDYLSENDAGAWASRFLSFFETLEEPHHSGSLAAVTDSLKEGAKLGKRLSFFLDYDGTLRDFVLRPEDAVPDEGLVPLLMELQKMGDIVIVSGRPMPFLEEHFGGYGFTLVAEHGYRWARSHDPEWQLVNPHVDISWKELVYPQLQQVTRLTPGTHIEEKPSALVWHYRGSDPEFGAWQAQRLLSELTELTANLPVAVHHGKMIVEISSLQVSKGVAMEALMQQFGTEIAMAAGDDQTDETMFASEPDLEAFHTIHLGGADTRASHLAGIESFRRFLEELAASITAS